MPRHFHQQTDLVAASMDLADRLGYDIADVRTELCVPAAIVAPGGQVGPVPIGQAIVAIVQAVFAGDTTKHNAEWLRLLIHNRVLSPQDINGRDAQGNTLLIALSAILPVRSAAADTGKVPADTKRNTEYIKLLRMLLELGACPNQRAPKADSFATPLMCASKAWHVEGVRALLEAGANPNVRDTKGFTAIMIACTTDDLNTGLDTAAGASVVQLLLDAGAMVGLVSTHGDSVLLECAISGLFQAVPLVLAAGESPDMCGLGAYSARGMAVFGAHDKLLTARQSAATTVLVKTAAALGALTKDVYSDTTPRSSLVRAVYADMLLDQLRRAAAAATPRQPATPHSPAGKLEEFLQATSLIRTIAMLAGTSIGAVAVTSPDEPMAPRSIDDWVAACSTCGVKTGVLTCKGCRVAKYCCAACQKKDWKSGHKHQCAWLDFTDAGARHWDIGGGIDNLDGGNLYLVIHQFLAATIPEVWTRLLSPTDLEELGEIDRAVLMTGHPTTLEPNASVDAVVTTGLLDFPHHFVSDRIIPRPFQSQANLAILATKPLQHYFSFSVPSDEALAAVCELGPILEIGAGSGYWSMLLRRREADVHAVDIRPPTSVASTNMFHPSTWTRVDKGSFEVLADPVHAGRVLFLSWPIHDPDESWDAECLEVYRGSTVVYVGSWNCGPTADPEFQGVCSSLQFQQALIDGWELQREIMLPRWPGARDTLTIWTRKPEPTSPSM
jgi:hypothetical protein